MSKVVLIKYLPNFRPIAERFVNDEQPPYNSSAVVVNSTAGDLIEIQGYPAIPRKEKYKCWNLFKQVLRDLLGILDSEVICVRFAYSPYDSICTLSDIFQEPSHVVNLIVSKLSNTSRNHNMTDSRRTEIENYNGPYCRFRKLYPVNNATTAVRSKCNFEEMNKLFSQLTEVSLSLQRTQQECDQIARRCKQKEEIHATIDGCPQTPHTKCVISEDNKIERLLCAAESLTHHAARNQKPSKKTGHVFAELFYSCNDPVYRVSSYRYQSVLKSQHKGLAHLPDPPTDVYVRPNFSGGAYVMWNPVSLTAKDENRGHRILGYQVFVNKQSAMSVEGCLSSQVELHALEASCQYTIQVCTHAEQCNSNLSTPVTYRHEVHKRLRRKSLPESLLHRTTTDQEQQHKVESWLESGRNLKRCDHSDSNRFNVTAPELSAEQLPSPHVHFDDDKINMAGISRSRLLADHSSCGDDTRSTSSSHTSGIVTDYLSSPKLSPAFDCTQCSCSSPSHQSNSALSTMHSLSKSHSQSHHHTSGSMFQDRTVTPSTLCASPNLSMFTLDDDTLDTAIDEPLRFKPSSRNFSSTPAIKGSSHVSSLRGPAAPQNFRVSHVPRAGCITVSWTPVRRDLKGCSSGCYVLGYRIYINGSYQQSVDGAMTFQTTVQCPSTIHLQHHRMKIHIKTRSIAGESLPSNTVVYDLLLQRVLESGSRAKTRDSVLSGTDCASLDPTESISSHNTALLAGKNLHLPTTRCRLETCI